MRILIVSILCSKSTLRIITIIISVAGLIVFATCYRYFTIIVDKNLDFPILSIYFLCGAAIITLLISNIPINNHSIYSLLTIVGLVASALIESGFRIQEKPLAVALYTILTALVVNSAVNYSFASYEEIPLMVIDKYEVDQFRASSTYMLVVSDVESSDEKTVSVSKEKYEDICAGDKTTLVKRDSIFSVITLADPEIEETRALDNICIGSKSVSDQTALLVAFVIGVICSIIVITGHGWTLIPIIYVLLSIAGCIYYFFIKKKIYKGVAVIVVALLPLFVLGGWLLYIVFDNSDDEKSRRRKANRKPKKKRKQKK